MSDLSPPPPAGVWFAHADFLNEAVDPALAMLVQRFGLRSAMGPWTTTTRDGLPLPEAQVRATAQRCTERLTLALEGACQRLGIDGTTWGKVAPFMDFRTPNEEQTQHRATGQYVAEQRRLWVDVQHDERLPGWVAPRLVKVLVHEWTHALDHYAVWRHQLPNVDPTMHLSTYVRLPKTQRDIDEPADLVRSGALMARILDEHEGREAPLLAHGSWARFVAQTDAKRWWRTAKKADYGRPHAYVASPNEMLARGVEFHERDDLRTVMNLPWSFHQGLWAVEDMPLRPLNATMDLVHAWMANEGVRSLPRLHDADGTADVPFHDLNEEISTLTVRPRRSKRGAR